MKEQNQRFFALLDNEKTVIQIVVADSIQACIEIFGYTEDNWKETFPVKREIYDEEGWLLVDTHNYARIGDIWSDERNNFIYPKPEYNPSWILNDECDWVPPIPKPVDFAPRKSDGVVYIQHNWNEANCEWEVNYLKWSKQHQFMYFWDKNAEKWIKNHEFTSFASGYRQDISNISPEKFTWRNEEEIARLIEKNKDIPDVFFVGIGTDLTTPY